MILACFIKIITSLWYSWSGCTFVVNYFFLSSSKIYYELSDLLQVLLMATLSQPRKQDKQEARAGEEGQESESMTFSIILVINHRGYFSSCLYVTPELGYYQSGWLDELLQSCSFSSSLLDYGLENYWEYHLELFKFLAHFQLGNLK